MATRCTRSRAMNWPRWSAELVVGVCGDVVELVDCDEAVIECGSTPNLSTAKRKVAWVQTSTLSSLVEERADGY